ncbi:hypothetical protein EG329_011456 [Mollisiaceae sp. DMI_Dod_QoI]|nr:hypothetical protein EG329_011456 [Helotiales sp. DMI_Dod_QoI]
MSQMVLSGTVTTGLSSKSQTPLHSTTGFYTFTASGSFSKTSAETTELTQTTLGITSVVVNTSGSVSGTIVGSGILGGTVSASSPGSSRMESSMETMPSTQAPITSQTASSAGAIESMMMIESSAPELSATTQLPVLLSTKNFVNHPHLSTSARRYMNTTLRTTTTPSVAMLPSIEGTPISTFSPQLRSESTISSTSNTLQILSIESSSIASSQFASHSMIPLSLTFPLSYTTLSGSNMPSELVAITLSLLPTQSATSSSIVPSSEQSENTKATTSGMNSLIPLSSSPSSYSSGRFSSSASPSTATPTITTLSTAYQSYPIESSISAALPITSVVPTLSNAQFYSTYVPSMSQEVAESSFVGQSRIQISTSPIEPSSPGGTLSIIAPNPTSAFFSASITRLDTFLTLVSEQTQTPGVSVQSGTAELLASISTLYEQTQLEVTPNSLGLSQETVQSLSLNSSELLGSLSSHYQEVQTTNAATTTMVDQESIYTIISSESLLPSPLLSISRYTRYWNTSSIRTTSNPNLEIELPTSTALPITSLPAETLTLEGTFASSLSFPTASSMPTSGNQLLVTLSAIEISSLAVSGSIPDVSLASSSESPKVILLTLSTVLSQSESTSSAETDEVSLTISSVASLETELLSSASQLSSLISLKYVSEIHVANFSSTPQISLLEQSTVIQSVIVTESVETLSVTSSRPTSETFSAVSAAVTIPPLASTSINPGILLASLSETLYVSLLSPSDFSPQTQVPGYTTRVEGSVYASSITTVKAEIAGTSTIQSLSIGMASLLLAKSASHSSTLQVSSFASPTITSGGVVGPSFSSEMSLFSSSIASAEIEQASSSTVQSPALILPSLISSEQVGRSFSLEVASLAPSTLALESEPASPSSIHQLSLITSTQAIASESVSVRYWNTSRITTSLILTVETEIANLETASEASVLLFMTKSESVYGGVSLAVTTPAPGSSSTPASVESSEVPLTSAIPPVPSGISEALSSTGVASRTESSAIINIIVSTSVLSPLESFILSASSTISAS